MAGEVVVDSDGETREAGEADVAQEVVEIVGMLVACVDDGEILGAGNQAGEVVNLVIVDQVDEVGVDSVGLDILYLGYLLDIEAFTYQQQGLFFAVAMG